MDEEPQHHDQKLQTPLLGDLKPTTVGFLWWRRQIAAGTVPFTFQNNFIKDGIGRTFRSTANLSNLLPTGTVLAFQLLSPIFTNKGVCDINSRRRSMTAGLLTTFALSCFLSSFTDSFRDENGKVRHGIATFRGLWVIDGSDSISPEEASEFRIKFVDFLHAFMSVLVFGAVALLDQNVVSCFYPSPSEKMKELLTAMPVGIGIIGSMCFVTFPTTRHGIGFPLSHR
ncbi:protein DMP6-like [Macadamia integrifolia]|uniref:protein DMP6-like n=1 Tax=Macadamia integrifolia TaxID=60698 RepID=UPI001C4EE29C|nr:protein DMP6-like [Macadamia integrifolia]